MSVYENFEKIDMSPEAITNRLKIMEQLWKLSINLMNAKEISGENLSNKKSFEKPETQILKLKSRKLEKLTGS